jgi:hypothetical protein
MDIMRYLVAIALAASSFAVAQPPSPPASASMCGECGVVRSVRGVTKQIRPSEAQDETKPSGFVASIPLKGGKPQVGSSEKIGKEAPTWSQTWEVIVLLDDGKFRVVTMDRQPDLRQGDKVRIENGKVVRRGE